MDVYIEGVGNARSTRMILNSEIMSTTKAPKWSEIHQDILLSVTQHIKLYSDYVRLRAVCVSWRTILPQFPLHNLPTQLPWLLLPSSPSPSSRRAFYDVTSGKTHSVHLPECSYPRRLLGSSHGFLVVVADSPHIFCYNPLTKFKAFLAPLSTLPGVVSFSFSNVGREYTIREPSYQNVYTLDLRQICDVFLAKVILSTPPTKDDCLAWAIISWRTTTELTYCKCGDSSWKSLSCENFSAQDVIYCQSNELFYAVNQIGDVAIFSPETMQIIRNVDTIEGDLKYLVKSKGELLLVARHLEEQSDLITYCDEYQTTEFRVYQFHEAGKEKVHWEPVTDLGDQVLFIGNNSSLALLASDFPGCKGNCIYYADDHSESSDAGIFDLSNGRIETLPCYPDDGRPSLQRAPPVWFTPNPY